MRLPSNSRHDAGPLWSRGAAGPFLAIAFVSSWACYWVAAFVPGVATPLHYLGGLMPTVVTLVFLFTIHDAAYRRDFLRRLADPRLIAPAVWLAILIFYPLKAVAAMAVDRILGGAGGAFEATHLVEQPILIAPTLVFLLLFGPIPEEIGWRGYALGGLLGPRPRRRRVLVASLVIGAVWTLWHVPLYFVEGTYQAEEVGFLTRRFWLFAGGTFFEPALYTAIFLATGGSTLAAILFHFAGNATGELLELSERAEGLSFALSLIAVAVVLGVLMRDPEGPRVPPPAERKHGS